MRKRRLVYKRDSEGKFARVNSLVGKVDLPSLRGGKLSSSKRKSLAQVLEARVSAGDLSYAIGPAKDLSGKYDLTGPDKADSNQAAYREAKKIARELKLKYGNNAPSANLIYRVARNIQIGKFDPNDPNAKKPGEDTGNPKPRKPSTPRVPKPDAPPKPKKVKRVSMYSFEGLATKDLIDQYKLAAEEHKKRHPNAPETAPMRKALMWLQARANEGDRDALDWFKANAASGDPKAPKLPRRSLTEIRRSIARAVRSMNEAYTNEERQLYQRKIDAFRLNFDEVLADSTVEQLKRDLDYAKGHYVNSGRDVKIYKERLKEVRNNPKSGFYALLRNAETDRAISLDTIKRIQKRLDELNGVKKDPGPSVDAPKLLPRNDDTSPTESRIAREKEVMRLFDGWFSGLYIDQLDKANGDNIGQWYEKFVQDPEMRRKALDDFAKILADPSSLADRRDAAYTYRDLTERFGYNDLSPEQRRALAKEDMALLDNMFSDKMQASRMRYAYEDWLRTSDGAHDLAKNYGYDNESLFEIFMDGNDRFPWTDRYHDTYKLADAVRAGMKADNFDGVAIAKEDRAPRPAATEDIPPVPYRAVDRSRLSHLKREKQSREREMIFFITKTFGNGEEFKKLTEDEQNQKRQQYQLMTDEISKLGAEIDKIGPDRSRSIRSAKNFDELYDIMVDRNPNIKNFNGWNEPDGALDRAMKSYGVHGEQHRKIILQRCMDAFEAAESMSDQYPDVPFDSLNVINPEGFSNPNAIAHCNRGVTTHIEFNASFLVDRTPAPGSNSDGFHPRNFEKDPFRNVLIHEFGHAIDWFAVPAWDVANDNGWHDRQTQRGSTVARDRMWKAVLAKIFGERDGEIKKIIADLFIKLQDEGYKGSFESWFKENTSGYAKENYHELIAESWQDYHANGTLNASPISVAITEFILSKYRARVREGSKPYDL